MPAYGAQPAHDPQRSPATLPSVNMPWHVRLRAVRVEFRIEIFEKFNFFTAAKFCALTRVKNHAGRWCAARSRPSEVPSNSAERRHAPAREIARNSNRISGRKFRKFVTAAKFCVRTRARSHQNPCRPVLRRLLTTLRGPQQLCRASACSHT